MSFTRKLCNYSKSTEKWPTIINYVVQKSDKPLNSHIFITFYDKCSSTVFNIKTFINPLQWGSKESS